MDRHSDFPVCLRVRPNYTRSMKQVSGMSSSSGQLYYGKKDRSQLEVETVLPKRLNREDRIRTPFMGLDVEGDQLRID